MAKKKSGIDVNTDDLLSSFGAAVGLVNENHNFDVESAIKEDAVSSGSRIADTVFGSPENPGLLFRGRITELTGLEGAGKTTFAIMTSGNAQKKGWNGIYFDTEQKLFSVDHMRKLGIDFNAKGSAAAGDGKIGFFKVIKCATLEDIDQHLMTFVENGLAEYIDYIWIDSIATAVPKSILGLGISDSRQLGQHAYGVQKLFAKLRYLKGEFNWAIGTINQLRRAPQIGSKFAANAVNAKGLGGSNDDTWTKTGGRAYLHDLHQAIFLQTYKMEKNEAGETVKQYIQVTTHKNMVGSTGRKAMIKLVQGRGFSDEDTLIEMMQEFGYIDTKHGGKYDVYTVYESQTPTFEVKGLENILPELKKRKILDGFYDLYFKLANENALEDFYSTDDDEEYDDEVEIE